MSMSNNKYCAVPSCSNSTVKNPSKLFFQLPRDAKMREKWMIIMKRTRRLGPKTRAVCCEDHFDIENDMENYMKYKILGRTQLKLKPNVVPHKFPWTVDKRNRSVLEKKEQAERSKLVEKLLSGEIPAAEGSIEEIFIVNPKPELDIEEKDPDPLESVKSDEEMETDNDVVMKHDRKVQCCIKPLVKHKSTMTEAKYLGKPLRRKVKRKPPK